MKKLLVALVTALALGGVAGGSTDPGSQTNATAPEVGDTFTVRLDGNPSTGYGWQAHFDKARLELVGSDFGHQGNGQVVGQRGVQVVEFRALAKGDTVITFSYKRPWESQVEKTSTHNVSVRGK